MVGGTTNGLKIYRGPKTRCDYCGKPFQDGEAITVCKEQDLAFHYTTAEGGCLVWYVVNHAEQLSGETMRFVAKTDKR